MAVFFEQPTHFSEEAKQIDIVFELSNFIHATLEKSIS